MTRDSSRAALAAYLVPFGMAAAIVFAPGNAGSRESAPSGHELVVRDVFARESLLKASNEADRPVVELNEELLRREDPVLREYYRRSQLQRDIARNDPALWRIEGRVVGMAPGVHELPSPFAPGAWQGDLMLAGGTEQFRLTLSDGRGRSAALDLLAGTTLDPRRRVVLVDVADPGRAYPPAAHLRFARQGSPQVFADVHATAGHVWIRSVAGGVLVDGLELAAGQGSVLEPGSRIEFRDRQARRSFQLTLARTNDAVVSRWNGVGVRSRDETYGWLAEAFEGAMDVAVDRCGEDCRFRGTSVQLTLDRSIDRSAQRALDSVAADDPWPAAVAVMDARTGDVLGLASHAPSPVGGNSSPLAASAARRLPLNYNFEPMAVGSAAKPLIAAAILANEPSLAALQVRADRSGEQVLGFEMRPPLGIDDGIADGTWIDLPTFLQHSSNLYAAALMVMSIDRAEGVPPTDARSGYRLGAGPPQARLPARDLADLGDRFYHLGHFPQWRSSLRTLYGIGASGSRAGASSPSLWRHLRRSTGQVHVASDTLINLDPLAPPPPQWGLDTRFTLRRTFIPVILGGQAFGWSTIDMAQAYSRIVTGVRLSARLVASRSETAYEQLAMPAEPRRVICQGLARVADSGTASVEPTLVSALASLRRDAPGSSIGFFSKTGTPEIDRLSELQRRRLDAEDRLLSEGKIFFGPTQYGSSKLHVLDQNGNRIAPATPTQVRQVADLLVARGVEQAVARAAAERMNRFNRGDPDQYRLDPQGVPSAVSRPIPTVQAFGHAFVFVVLVHSGAQVAPDDCTRDPTAAFAVAINVQEEADSRSALKIAAALLGEGSALRERIISTARMARGAGALR